MDVEWKVKKGDKFVFEIEFTKDCDLFKDTEILASVYREKELDGCFKVITIHLIKTFDEYKKRLAAAINDAILNNKLDIKPIQDEQPNIT